MIKIKYMILMVVSLILTSCLESGLEELPTYSDASITSFKFEYRWIDDSNLYGKLQVIQLTSECVIDESNNTIDCTVTVPPASETFPEEIRSNVTINNIIGYADISPAAVLKPLDGSIVLGTPGNYGNSNKYEVMAADKKTVEIWTVRVVDFNK